jgi:hypothetical protein
MRTPTLLAINGEVYAVLAGLLQTRWPACRGSSSDVDQRLECSSADGYPRAGPGSVPGTFRVHGLCPASEGRCSLRLRIATPLRGGMAVP